MAKSGNSAPLIAQVVREQREELVRHLDAVDTKCGVVLGFSGAVAALGSRSATPAHAPGLTLAVIAGLLALRALLPQHFPTWEVAALRRYLNADPTFTQRRTLDTSIEIVIRLKASIEQKIPWLRAAVVTLAVAVLATALGTIVD